MNHTIRTSLMIKYSPFIIVIILFITMLNCKGQTDIYNSPCKKLLANDSLMQINKIVLKDIIL
jgi:hypothetical protein